MKKKTLLYLGAAAVGAAASAYMVLYLRQQALLLNARADVARQNHLDEYGTQDRYCRVLGGDTHYYVAGLNHHTMPLVFLHGGVIEAASFLDNMSVLASERTVLAPDMPAHGRSSFLAPQHTLTWFNAWLDAMQIEQFDLCAHSMGGSLAVRYAAAYPHRVRRLILCSPTSFGIGFPRITVTPRLKHFSDDLLDYLWGTPQRLTLGQKYQFNLILKEFFSSGRWWWYLSGGFGWLLDLPTTLLRRLHTPTLVLWGDRDRLVPMNPETVAWLPNAQVKIFEGVGHMPYMEIQSEFDEELKKFLAA